MTLLEITRGVLVRANGPITAARRFVTRWVIGVAATSHIDDRPDSAVDAGLAAVSPEPRPATEWLVVAALLNRLDDLASEIGPIQQAALEVRTHGRSRADLLVLADDLVSVEAKLTDWKRALGQALLNTSVVDRSYVAMWDGRIPDALLVEAKQHGLGVLAISNSGARVLLSAPRGRPDRIARATLLGRLSTAPVPTAAEGDAGR